MLNMKNLIVEYSITFFPKSYSKKDKLKTLFLFSNSVVSNKQATRMPPAANTTNNFENWKNEELKALAEDATNLYCAALRERDMARSRVQELEKELKGLKKREYARKKNLRSNKTE